MQNGTPVRVTIEPGSLQAKNAGWAGEGPGEVVGRAGYEGRFISVRLDWGRKILLFKPEQVARF